MTVVFRYLAWRIYKNSFMTVKAVCTDIDGTLLDKQRQLSRKTIETFRNIGTSIPIILASSRMPAAMVHLQEELGILGNPLIAYNGGYIIRYSYNIPLRVYNSVTIPLDVCDSILGLVSETELHASLYFEDEWYAPAHDQWTIREETITKVKAIIAPPKDVLSDWNQRNAGAHKIMCMGDARQISWLKEKLHEKHGQDIHVYLSRPTYLELAPRSISKGSALKLLLEDQYRISISDTVAFGDNYNDIDMLQMAGLGVAVNNARDEVKAVADSIALNSIDDGVALALENLINN
jgi:Cof subfamily protein (haloacid dehalogenase superfamily)